MAVDVEIDIHGCSNRLAVDVGIGIHGCSDRLAVDVGVVGVASSGVSMLSISESSCVLSNVIELIISLLYFKMSRIVTDRPNQF